MKYLSFVIPCYNSEDYMARAIESVLVGGEDVEIIVVDDGSSDHTAKIAQDYEAKYPTIVKAVSQKNGGHGAAVNTGLEHATGLYFKVVDSDDWVDATALNQMLSTIQSFVQKEQWIDMFISNYVYEKVGVKHKNVVRYTNALPQNCVFTWDDIKHFRLDQYILMHSVIYRTALLKEMNLTLPRHTFYVDNIYVYQPLPHVKSMYYMDIDFYRYYIGRDDQSVNEPIMIQRIDQQIFITETLIQSYPLENIQNVKLRRYMRKYISIMMTVSSVFLIRSHTEENLRKKDQLWQFLKDHTVEEDYKHLRYGFLGLAVNLPGKIGRKCTELGYLLARKLIGFQ